MACDPQIYAKLLDAREKYHQLITGTMARVVVDQNGERVEFTATNAAQLRRYIQDLEAQCNSTPRVGGPVGMFF